MSFTPFYVPFLRDEGKWHDLRITIPGNSETWYRVQKLTDFTGLTIHHTAGLKNQTPDSIALYHVQVRKWGGIGYHFLIDYKGNVYYVGDVSTQRAHVANLNHKYLGISLIGDFTNIEPTKEQLKSAHLLCKEFVEYDDRFNITWDNVKQHRRLQATACPGNTVGKCWNKIILGVPGGKPCLEKLREAEVKVIEAEREVEKKTEGLKRVNKNLIKANNKVLDLGREKKELEDDILELKEKFTKNLKAKADQCKIDKKDAVDKALKNQAKKHKIAIDGLQTKITDLENSKEYKVGSFIVKVFNKITFKKEIKNGSTRISSNSKRSSK